MELKLFSPSFNDLDFLPDIFSGYGKDISPELHIEQGSGYGWFRYRWPKTPKGETHIYVYTVYVLDTKLKASRFSNKKKILNLAEEHILQKAELRIRYTPNRQQ